MVTLTTLVSARLMLGEALSRARVNAGVAGGGGVVEPPLLLPLELPLDVVEPLLVPLEVDDDPPLDPLLVAPFVDVDVPALPDFDPDPLVEPPAGGE
jgi:hypothetical protein